MQFNYPFLCVISNAVYSYCVEFVRISNCALLLSIEVLQNAQREFVDVCMIYTHTHVCMQNFFFNFAVSGSDKVASNLQQKKQQKVAYF